MLRLRDIMTTDVLTVGPETTLREAVDLLATHHVSGFPVVDASGVVGVVSSSDLLAFEASTPPVPGADDEPEEWGELSGWERGDEPAARYFTDAWSDAGADTTERFARTDSPEWDLLAEHTVAEVMTRQVLALPPTA